MKRFITLMAISCFSFLMAQDEAVVAGTYKLTGTNVRYTSLLRQTSTLWAHDTYNFDISLPLLTFAANEPAGQIINGPFNEQNLQFSGALLNVTFKDDGTGIVNQGSYYPTLVLENCISTGGANPITDDLVYTASVTPSNYVQTVNWIGLETMSPISSKQAFDTDGNLCFDDDGDGSPDCNVGGYGPGFAGAISLSQTEVLDFFNAGQTAGAGGACRAGFNVDQTLCCGAADLNGDGSIGAGEFVGDGTCGANTCAFYEGCSSAGYISLGADIIEGGHTFETIEDNGPRDLYVEWHAIDGTLSGSGFGDDIDDPCEDGLCIATQNEIQCQEADGTVSPACTEGLESYDRILGVPGVPSTHMNPECGFGVACNEDDEACVGSYIAGDPSLVVPGLAAGVYGACVSGVQTNDSGNPDGTPNLWPDVVDGCFYVAQTGDTNFDGVPDTEGITEGAAATLAFIGACTQLGFDAATCTSLATAATFQIVGQEVCYEPVSHGLAEQNDDGTCEAGWVPYILEWDCLGLAALTTQAGLPLGSDWDGDGTPNADYDPYTLCGVAADGWIDQCVQKNTDGSFEGGLSRTFLVLSPELATWGGFFTFNAANYTNCVTQTGDPSLCTDFLANDGGSDFDLYACGTTGDCKGRLMMEMDATCVPTFDVREVHIDFDEISCEANGDVNLDAAVNILDIVNLVQIIIGQAALLPEQFCNANYAEGAYLDILDIIQLVADVLDGDDRAADASMIEIFNNDNTVTIEADGFVGAVQMTLEHDHGFLIEMTDDALIALAHTDGIQTTLMVVNPISKLFTAQGNFEIVEIIAGNSQDYIDVVNPEAISLSEAYPNPFNPTTSVNLQVGIAGHVNMNVYNLMGQVVSTLVNNTMDAGNYNITWNAGSFASGMYIIKAESLNGVAVQKVTLVK